MKVLISVASAGLQYVETIRSCYWQMGKNGDEIVDSFNRRGDIGRESFADILLHNPKYDQDDALLLLDADQKHPIDMLKKLRVHNLDMVCAHYYARDAENIKSMCYERVDGVLTPLKDIPKSGMHKIDATGWGCVLVKKKVIAAVREITPEGVRTMGTDLDFFTRAGELGYQLWLDADVESEHAVTILLNHKTAERLK